MSTSPPRPAILAGFACSLAIGLLASCASAPAIDASRPYGGAAARGADLARAQCAACHAIGVGAHHPATEAPDFASVAARYRDYRLDWELEAISSVGHYRMPRKPLTQAEIADLTAFIRSQEQAPPRP